MHYFFQRAYMAKLVLEFIMYEIYFLYDGSKKILNLNKYWTNTIMQILNKMQNLPLFEARNPQIMSICASHNCIFVLRHIKCLKICRFDILIFVSFMHQNMYHFSLNSCSNPFSVLQKYYVFHKNNLLIF